eukprot:scaffold127995_cov31-Tisochrysis_lutea.AAC.1
MHTHTHDFSQCVAKAVNKHKLCCNVAIFHRLLKIAVHFPSRGKHPVHSRRRARGRQELLCHHCPSLPKYLLPLTKSIGRLRRTAGAAWVAKDGVSGALPGSWGQSISTLPLIQKAYLSFANAKREPNSSEWH